MRDRAHAFRLQAMCRVFGVHRSGSRVLARPLSVHAREEDRLLGLVKRSWLVSGGVYGYRKVTNDLREQDETCGKYRVARLMRSEGLKARADVFDYIEMFYNTARRHGNNQGLSPIEYEKQSLPHGS